MTPGQDKENNKAPAFRNAGAFLEVMTMSGNSGNGLPLEIERKYLVRMPELRLLDRLASEKARISQTYLLRREDGANRRVRRWETERGVTWFYTEKTRLTDVTRVEREREISSEEAERLLLERDPERRTVEKTRWRIPWAGHTLEVDVFPFWEDRAFCEAELGSEEEEILLPDWLQPICEVTADPRYTNSALALSVPMDILPPL